jgi:hypothetical protein
VPSYGIDQTVPFPWLVDNIRSTLKPSSWTGLADYGETINDCYRKSFWPEMPACVEVFCEKDAIAGTIHPITAEYDVALRVIRGYGSVSYLGEIGSSWRKIQKPIHCYYAGDFDPSGIDIERDCREKLERYSGKTIHWHRLGVSAEDFQRFSLIRLPVKSKDARSTAFIERHGPHCAEVDALPPTELRRRVEEAINRHINQQQWAALLRTEELERKALKVGLDQLSQVVAVELSK